MFGSEYYKHPEILMDSFKEMSGNKKSKSKKNSNFLFFLEKFYLRIFGIPEIGFQIRSNYFKSILNSEIKMNKINKILDAGSGIGIYSFWLSKKFPKSRITGFEIDKNKLNFSKKFASEINTNNIKFVYQDISKKVKGKQKYDLIVNIDVLEHIKNYREVLRNFYSLLNSGGYLYIHTPQINQQRIFKQFQKWHHEDHVREGFAPGELVKELEKLGFRIVGIKETFGFFGKLVWELNHMSFNKGFVAIGILFPFFYLLSNLDLVFNNKQGLAIAILVKKQ